MHLNTKNDSNGKSDRVDFHKILLPTGDIRHIPDDITIEFPKESELPKERLHLQAYIPWDDSYEAKIPVQYQYFFTFVLPYLGERSSHIHTALAVSYVPELMKAIGKPDDGQSLYLSVILHDCGWSLMLQSEIADSLDYKGTTYTLTAAHAKVKHTIYGGALAFQILDEYSFEQPMGLEQKEFISDIVRYHEAPFRYDTSTESMPRELAITCEADRLCMFSREMFWLDTIRKDVEPQQYLEALAKAATEIPLTESGKRIADEMVVDRRTEVQQLGSKK